MSENIKPYQKEQDKKEQVRTMFNRIAFRYDILNRVLSLGVDIRWRKKLIKALSKDAPRTVLDIATGTGDLAIMTARTMPQTLVTGIDLSPQMLEIAKKKTKNIQNIISLTEGDAENLPFGDCIFDAITVSFGVRNFENIENGVRQMYRVLTQGGTLYVLEFGMPRNNRLSTLYTFYFRRLLPFVGGIISGERRAYRYLQESVEAFEYGDKFAKRLYDTGFKNVSQTSLTGGIAIIYRAEK